MTRQQTMIGGAALLALGCAFLAANFLRYEPLPATSADTKLDRVWDRIGQRECLVLRPDIADHPGVACDRRSLVALLRANSAADPRLSTVADDIAARGAAPDAAPAPAAAPAEPAAPAATPAR